LFQLIPPEDWKSAGTGNRHASGRGSENSLVNYVTG
jgi:hypothetical protein